MSMTAIKKRFVVKNELTHERVIAIGILVFLINFIPPIYAITQNRYPTGVELLNSSLLGILEVAVILYALLQRIVKATEEHTHDETEEDE